MRMLVLGAGRRGSAGGYDLLQQSAVERVTLADLKPGRLPAFLKKKSDKRLVTARLDAKQSVRLRKLMHGHDAVLNALPYYFNYSVARNAIAAGPQCGDVRRHTRILSPREILYGCGANYDVCR